jgi:hypothetical protein
MVNQGGFQDTYGGEKATVSRSGGCVEGLL